MKRHRTDDCERYEHDIIVPELKIGTGRSPQRFESRTYGLTFAAAEFLTNWLDTSKTAQECEHLLVLIRYASDHLYGACHFQFSVVPTSVSVSVREVP